MELAIATGGHVFLGMRRLIPGGRLKLEITASAFYIEWTRD
jgi:hypothetical protein